jgi:transglutaminase-like putative cysteine protease
VRRSDFFTLGILLLMLLAVVGSIINAEWMPGLDAIAWAVVFGLMAGTALAYSHFPSWTAHLTSLVYGAFAAVVIGIATDPEITRLNDVRERVLLLIDKVIAWVREAATNGTSQETVIFVLILSGLFWLLAHTAAWYSFRKHRIWHVILPAGVTLFSNVYYYAGGNSMVPYLVIYLICAVVLLVLSHLAEREEGWLAERVRFTPSMRGWFVVAGIGIAAFAGLVGWRVSEATTSSNGRNLLQQLSQPYNELMARWNRLFANLNNSLSQNVDAFNSSVTLGGPRSLSSELVMEVIAPPARHYWRATSYDSYDGRTWRNTIDTITTLSLNDTTIPLAGYAERVPVQAEFTLSRGTDSVYVPSQPLRTNVTTQATFELVSNGNVDLVQLKLSVPLLPGNRYSALGSMSVANVDTLRGDSGAYPAWIDRYRQVPPTVPDRVKDLAAEITANAITPFDKAVLIERWLRENIAYDEQLEAPPANVEASDYILFNTRRAYCNYYATAMVAMLRSQGIPARVAAGYAQGELQLDPSGSMNALFKVKGTDAHMWVEVFFPDYGWVEFEPTAGQPPINRFEPQMQQIPTPQPTATPLPPPTPTPQPNQPAEPPTPTPEPALPQVPEQPSTPPPPTLNDMLQDAWQWFLGSPFPYLIALALLALAGVMGLRYAETAGLSKLPGIERAYALLSRYAGWLGIGKMQQHTPYEQADELARRAPNAQQPMRRITDLYVEKRFSPPEAAKSASNVDADDAWQQARTWLRQALIRRK